MRGFICKSAATGWASPDSQSWWCAQMNVLDQQDVGTFPTRISRLQFGPCMGWWWRWRWRWRWCRGGRGLAASKWRGKGRLQRVRGDASFVYIKPPRLANHSARIRRLVILNERNLTIPRHSTGHDKMGKSFPSDLATQNGLIVQIRDDANHLFDHLFYFFPAPNKVVPEQAESTCNQSINHDDFSSPLFIIHILWIIHLVPVPRERGERDVVRLFHPNAAETR